MVAKTGHKNNRIKTKRQVATGSTKRAVRTLKEWKESGTLKKEVKIKYRRHSNALSKHKNKRR